MSAMVLAFVLASGCSANIDDSPPLSNVTPTADPPPEISLVRCPALPPYAQPTGEPQMMTTRLSSTAAMAREDIYKPIRLAVGERDCVQLAVVAARGENRGTYSFMTITGPLSITSGNTSYRGKIPDGGIAIEFQAEAISPGIAYVGAQVDAWEVGALKFEIYERSAEADVNGTNAST